MSLLSRHQHVNRQYFDPTNADHVESLKEYLRTGNWGNVQFFAELPFIEVPMTVITKYARHQLNVVPETNQEKNDRLTAKNVIRIK